MYRYFYFFCPPMTTTSLTSIMVSFSSKPCLFLPVQSLTIYTFPFIQLFGTNGCSIFRSALRRTVFSFTIGPFFKRFSAPFTNKDCFVGWIWFLVIIIGAFSRTKFSIWLTVRNSLFFSAFQTFIKYVPVLYSTFHRTKFRRFSIDASTLISKFNSAILAFCSMLYVFIITFLRTIFRDISRTSITIVKNLSTMNTGKIIFRGLWLSHLTVSDFVYSDFLSGAHQSEFGACQQFMTLFKPNRIIAQMTGAML